MLKLTAINLLGGTARETARRMDLSTQAINKWPDEGPMSRPICDRVLAYLVREACKRDATLRVQLNVPADALALPVEHDEAEAA